MVHRHLHLLSKTKSLHAQTLPRNDVPKGIKIAYSFRNEQLNHELGGISAASNYQAVAADIEPVNVNRMHSYKIFREESY